MSDVFCLIQSGKGEIKTTEHTDIRKLEWYFCYSFSSFPFPLVLSITKYKINRNHTISKYYSFPFTISILSRFLAIFHKINWEYNIHIKQLNNILIIINRRRFFSKSTICPKSNYPFYIVICDVK